MSARAFLLDNARWLTAGALLMLSSSFGQTYFISIFAGEIRGTFGLSHGQWGGIYTIGTLASAVAMLYAGGLTDRFRVRQLAPWVLVGLAAMCLAMAVIPYGWMLIPVIFGLRFCGQGMLSHTASVALARWFARNRGRANALMSLGFLAGESSFPFLFVILTGLVGWRVSWVVAAGLALVFIPVFRRLLRVERQPGTEAASESVAGMDGRHWTRAEALKHWLFWVIATGIIGPPTFGTAFFFQQVHMTSEKGWALEAFVVLIPLYSLSAFLSLFSFGALADRFGSGLVLSCAMLPAAAAFLVFAQADTLFVAAIGMVLLGGMSGAMGTIAGAFWPEYYGTRHIGSVRSIATSLMVFGSAIGPGLTGMLIDAGVSYDRQLTGIAIYFAAVSLLMLTAYLKTRRLLPARPGPVFSAS